MNRDMIERLAIDSSAGELNEDAEALLQSCLAEHPQAKQWAEAVRRIYDKTDAAIRTKTAHAGMGNAAPRMRPVSQVRWLSVARWAAAVLLGAFIGFAAGRREVPDTTHRIAFQEPTRDPKQVETISELKERYTGTFWGDKMLALLEHKPGRQYETDLRGIRSWDKYRQYLKENHYE